MSTNNETQELGRFGDRGDGHSKFIYPAKIDDGTGMATLEAFKVSATNLKAARGMLSQVLDGRSSILPVPAADSPDAGASDELKKVMRAGEPVEAGTLVATTSGSTGTPKGALLSAANLRSSARATEQVLRKKLKVEPGPWLLALPAHHIAGLQVILRGMMAGFTPVATTALIEGTGFSVSGFAADAAALKKRFPHEDLHTSLVPPQVHSLLESEEGIEALKLFGAVLIGGAALGDKARQQLDEAGVNYVLTYGSSETSGGMVYDGQALPGATVSIEDADANGAGRIVLEGPMVARGYRNKDEDCFPELGVYRTSDIGALDGDTLQVLGRADGAINTGGVKVLPEQSENATRSHAVVDGEAITEVCVSGVSDEHWGEAVVAVLRTAGAEASGEPVEVTDAVRSSMREAGCADYLIPRRAFAVAELPKTGPGKLDRIAIAELARQAVDAN